MTEQIGDQKTVITATAAELKSASASASTATATATSVRASTPASTSRSASAPVSARQSSTALQSAAASVPGAAASGQAPGFDTRHAVLRYTTLRLALFLVALLVVWGVAMVFNMDLSSQLSKLTLLAVALLLSSAASFIVLSKYRDAMSAGIVARTERLSKKFDDAAALEDEEED